MAIEQAQKPGVQAGGQRRALSAGPDPRYLRYARRVSRSDCPCCARVLRSQRVARGEEIETGEIIAQNEHAIAFRDPNPVNQGHTLVVPLRHEPDLLELGLEEQRAVWALATEVARELCMTELADGVNIGANIGRAAGQTMYHAHVHVIPRWVGDVEDPRGGVRCVVSPR